MARLPVPGGDVDDWAAILNEYLLATHNPDGTQRDKSVGLKALGTINLPTDPPIKTPILSNNGSHLIWKSTNEINVRDFGAKGDGKTDDTAAIQAAIDVAGDGGNVQIPQGTFMVRGLKIKKSGTRIAGDARWGTRLVRLGGNLPIIDVSGTTSKTGHLRFSTIANLTLNGNHKPGVLLRSYYADSSTFSDLHFVYCDGVATDMIEAWDTRFLECIWENCGTVDDAAVLLRNSMPPGQFGYSDDNTNQVYFTGCRWETFRNGAIKMDGQANGSTRKLNGIFFTSCKMETRYCAGPVIHIMPGTTIVFVNQLYIAIMAALPIIAKPIDAIIDYGSHIFMTDVYVQWGFEVRLANSLVHVFQSGPHLYYKLSTFYPTGDPVEGAVIAEPGSTDVIVSCNVTNRGRLTIGDVGNVMVQSPNVGIKIPLNASGKFTVSSHITGKDLVNITNSGTRPALNMANGTDITGYSDNYTVEKWRVVGASGSAKFAGGQFRVEGTRGYVGVHANPERDIAMLIKPAGEGHRGLTIIRPTATATNRLVEFQDEKHTIQGMAIDSNGRLQAVGTPARVTKGDQVSYANPGIQVRDIAGNITAAVRSSPTAPGTIATVTFSRPYAQAPLYISLADHSDVSADLYVSARNQNGFTVSTRTALRGGSMVSFDYAVIA